MSRYFLTEANRRSRFVDEDHLLHQLDAIARQWEMPERATNSDGQFGWAIRMDGNLDVSVPNDAPLVEMDAAMNTALRKYFK